MGAAFFAFGDFGDPGTAAGASAAGASAATGAVAVSADILVAVVEVGSENSRRNMHAVRRETRWKEVACAKETDAERPAYLYAHALSGERPRSDRRSGSLAKPTQSESSPKSVAN